jgi:hypothetical protein
MIDKEVNPESYPPEKRDFIHNDFLFWPPRKKKKTALKFLQQCRGSLCCSNITDDVLNGMVGITFDTTLGTPQIFLVALFF